MPHNVFLGALGVLILIGCGGATAEVAPPSSVDGRATRADVLQQEEAAPELRVADTIAAALEDGDTVHPQDGSFYDEYTYDVPEGFTIDVQMHSSDFDSYLHLLGPSEFDQQADDIAPGNLDARIQIIAPSSGTYTILANSRGRGETGAYTIEVRIHPSEGAAP